MGVFHVFKIVQVVPNRAYALKNLNNDNVGISTNWIEWKMILLLQSAPYKQV